MRRAYLEMCPVWNSSKQLIAYFSTRMGNLNLDYVGSFIMTSPRCAHHERCSDCLLRLISEQKCLGTLECHRNPIYQPFYLDFGTSLLPRGDSKGLF